MAWFLYDRDLGHESVKSVEFIPQRVTFTSCRFSIPAISHLDVFCSSPENGGNNSKHDIIFFLKEFMSLRQKKVEPSAYSVQRKT